MKRVGVLVFLGVLAMCLPAHAVTVTFQLDSMTVTSPDPDNGLELVGGLNYVPDPFDLECPDGNCGGHIYFENLFYLDTPETWVNPDDQNVTPFTLTFNFSLPSDGGQDVSGTVYGTNYFIAGSWTVNFTNPYEFEFNAGGYEYTLMAYISPDSATTFIPNLCCDPPSFSVEFKLKECEAVPIPGALWLLGSGLVGLVGSRRLRNRA